MSRYQFRWSDSASFLMLTAAACVYVAAHWPNAAARQTASVGQTAALHHDTQGVAGTYTPSTKRLCVRRTRPGEPQATVGDYGPCLMVHWLPTVPLRKYSVGMV